MATLTSDYHEYDDHDDDNHEDHDYDDDDDVDDDDDDDYYNCIDYADDAMESDPLLFLKLLGSTQTNT